MIIIIITTLQPTFWSNQLFGEQIVPLARHLPHHLQSEPPCLPSCPPDYDVVDLSHHQYHRETHADHTILPPLNDHKYHHYLKNSPPCELAMVGILSPSLRK